MHVSQTARNFSVILQCYGQIFQLGPHIQRICQLTLFCEFGLPYDVERNLLFYSAFRPPCRRTSLLEFTNVKISLIIVSLYLLCGFLTFVRT